MKKRNKIIFGIAVVCIIFVGIVLFFIHKQPQKETEVAYKEEDISEEPEISDTRKELERLLEERGYENHCTQEQSYLLVWYYNYPLLEDMPEEYSFEDQMDLYLMKMSKLAEKEGQHDFLYNAISDGLIWDYHFHEKELSEEDCERFLSIINLCQKRLETAKVWEEPPVEPPKEIQETITIQLTDARKELEFLYEECDYYDLHSEEGRMFLKDNYDISFSEEESSENNFEECYNSYLDQIEEVVEEQEGLLLLKYVSESLILDYDDYRGKLTEEQCERMVDLIKLYKK